MIMTRCIRWSDWQILSCNRLKQKDLLSRQSKAKGQSYFIVYRFLMKGKRRLLDACADKYDLSFFNINKKASHLVDPFIFFFILFALFR